MSWTLIVILALILFVNRYLFLEPKLPLRLPVIINEALRFSAPCLLTAICGPIILLEQGELRPLLNPYLLGAIGCVLIALLIRNTIFCVIASLMLFYLLVYWL